MDLQYIRTLVDHLDARGVLFDQGLTDEEVERVEAAHGFRFPPDLRKLLQRALPVGERFPNWRKGPPAALKDSLGWPMQGILDEVERHGFWLPAWGPRPDQASEIVARAREHLRAAPPLVPIYGHRYLPAEPCLAGNPVFTVVGTDVIYAGCDLPSYFTVEFGVACPEWAATSPRPIAFWADLVS